MQDLAAALLAEDAETPAGDAPAAPEEDRPLTKKELDAYLAERQKATEKTQSDKAAEDAVVADAEKLGYTRGTRQYQSLMWEALHTFGGDLTKAHEALEAEKSQIIEQFKSGKRADADSTPVAGGDGSAPGHEKAPTTWAAARASTEARAKAIPQ
jgi:flagellar biosynthesis/type III secretory pathway protein FliH